VVIPGGTKHEAWFRKDTEVIDFFTPPRRLLFTPKNISVRVVREVGPW